MESINGVNVNNKTVIVRVDYNVPIEDGKIVDDTRIVGSLQTIKYLLDNNAKIVLLSHLGRIKSEGDKKVNTLDVVARKLSTYVDCPVYFVPVTRGKLLEKTVENLLPGEILLVENTRFEDFPKTLESSCDEALSKYWASLADMFVMDAFGTAHRCHASTYGIPKYIPAYSGFLVDKEMEMLSLALHQRRTLVLGGAKVDDKIGVIDNLINTTDKLLLGGAMCFTFLAAKGYNVGKSIVSLDKLEYALNILNENADKILLPDDVVTQNGVKLVNEMSDDDIGYDIGPKTIIKYIEQLSSSKLVLWNGPLGKYEDEEYRNGTLSIMKYLYDEAIPTILAGGDITAASARLNFKFKYVSTGGGSTLEYLEGKRFKVLERLNGDKK